MDGRFQVGHQDAPDLLGIFWIGRHGRVGDDGNLRGMKWNGGNVRLELIMDDLHDRRVEGHADPQEGSPVPHLLDFFAQILDRPGVTAQDNLVR